MFRILVICAVMLLLVGSRGTRCRADQQLQQLASVCRDLPAATDLLSQLSRRSDLSVLQVLSAMPSQHEVAENWYLALAQTLADRDPAAAARGCQQFLENAAGSPAGRYWAFSFVTERQPQLREPLLAGMLEDTSMELRYEAIGLQLRRLELAPPSAEQEWRAAHRRLLASARLPAQVRQIAQLLKDRGEVVDLCDHFGFLTRWYVVGTFDNSQQAGFEVVYAPEGAYLAERLSPSEQLLEAPGYQGNQENAVRWRELSTRDEEGKVDLAAAYDQAKGAVVYALGSITSRESSRPSARRHAHGIKVWVNGQPLIGREVYHAGDQIDQYVAPGTAAGGAQHAAGQIVPERTDRVVGSRLVFSVASYRLDGRSHRPERFSARNQTMMLRQKFVTGLVGVLLGGTAPLALAQWPGFLGPEGNPVVARDMLPERFSVPQADASGSNVAWRRALGGRAVSGPIVVGDKVITTSSSAMEERWIHVTAVWADTGEVAWHRSSRATGRPYCHSTSANAAPTPCSDGQRVYALFSSNDLVCYDLLGQLVWYRSLVDAHPLAGNDVGMSSSPVLIDGVLVITVECQGDSFATGIDAVSGQTLWEIPRTRKANWSSPRIVSGLDGARVAVIHNSSGAIGVDPRSGKIAWQLDERCSTIATAAHADAMLSAADGLAALPPDTGTRPARTAVASSRLNPSTASPLSGPRTGSAGTEP